MFAGIADALARIAPEVVAAAIVGMIFRLITHAIDDKDRWRRLMFLVVPLLVVVLALAGMAVWWLLGERRRRYPLARLRPDRTTPGCLHDLSQQMVAVITRR